VLSEPRQGRAEGETRTEHQETSALDAEYDWVNGEQLMAITPRFTSTDLEVLPFDNKRYEIIDG
jgi:hypothetical protein